MLFDRVIQTEEGRKPGVFEGTSWNSGRCVLVHILWNLCINTIKGKVPDLSVLFRGDMYHAVLALPCSTRVTCPGTSQKSFIEKSLMEKLFFKWRFKAYKLTNFCLVQRSILIRYKISPIKISDKTYSAHCDIQHTVERKG